uniref:Uncharacterized protein n=1 Tax=Terrapene triunguis TaxID=2587831 RepID=A0A674IUX6_9SAUR
MGNFRSVIMTNKIVNGIKITTKGIVMNGEERLETQLLFLDNTCLPEMLRYDELHLRD